MKFTKEQKKLSDIFFTLMSQNLEDIITIPATNKKTGAKTIVVCVAEKVNKDEADLVPFCVLFTPIDNPFNDFEIDLRQNMDIVPVETRRRRWWLLWLA